MASNSSSNSSDDDGFNDDIFISASQQYELSTQQQEPDDEKYELECALEEKYGDMEEEDFSYDRLMKGVTNKPAEPVSEGDSRFAEPVSEGDILAKIDGMIPKGTRKSTTWSVNTWQEWSDHRQRLGSEFPPKLDAITNKELNYWLARFVVEARNKKGEAYEGGSLYSLCAGIQRYLRAQRRGTADRGQVCDLDIYKDASFAYFRSVLDSALKELHQQGIGISKKRAEVISEDVEETMWKDNILGDDTPVKLLDTLMFCFGLNFALRSGQEHRKLRPDMELKEPRNSTAYIVYTESGSKNRQGGLKERQLSNKSIKYFANDAVPSRCGVRLYKKYMSLRPPDAPRDIFYLKPFPEPRSHCWYYPRPVGHNVLNQTVKKLCSKVGAEGYFTNHSLRRTCATRLFQKGIDEQQIMGITGHRSSNAVRVYKEISHEQEGTISELIRPVKKCKMDNQKVDKNEQSTPGPVFNFSGCSVIFNNK